MIGKIPGTIETSGNFSQKKWCLHWHWEMRINSYFSITDDLLAYYV